MKILSNHLKRTDSFVLIIITTIIVLFSTQLLNAQTNKFIPASDTNIRYSGRIDDRDPGNIFFAYPGVSIKAKFEGTSISVFLTDYGTNFFNIIIDGEAPTVLPLSQSQTLYELASGLTDGIHTVEIFKRTETSVGKVAFKGFVIDAGKKLLPLDPPSSRTIEFIGNSITCGYGNEISTNNPSAFPFTPKNEDNYKAWGAVAARTLNAEYSCIAYSGRGLYQNYSGEKTGTIPLIYDRVNADESGLNWNHFRYTPDVIVINLGTNDFSAEISSAANTVDSTVFASTYVNFIKKLRSYYPNASIICCVGVMMNDGYPSGKYQWTRIQKYVSSVRDYFNNNGDSKVYYLKLDPQTGPYGEDWHPTAATDQKMATALVNFINTNINWDDCPGSVDLGKDINLKYSVTPVILNANTSENAESSLSWYKNDVLIAGATGATYQIDDTTGASGVYKVVKDSAQCKYEDIVTVKNELQTINAICKWQDNKKAAVVLTFDDWSAGHPAIVVPELNKRSIKGTFYPITKNISNWTSISNAALDGHEIGNHSKTHPDLTALNEEGLRGEIDFADSLINKNITNQVVSTFDYPFGANSNTVIDHLINMKYVAARGVQPSSINYTYNFASTIRDYYRLLTLGMSENSSASGFATEIRKFITSGGLLTVMYHSVSSSTVIDNNYAPVSEPVFQFQMDTLLSFKRNVWITTLSDAIKYHREASCAKLVQIQAPDADKWVLNLTDTISDSTIYNYPLSIALKMNGMNFDMVKQGNQVLQVDSIYNDTILFRAVPDKGFITLLHSGIDLEINVSQASFTNTAQNTITCTVVTQSTSGISSVIADLSEVGGNSETTMTLGAADTYTVQFTVEAGAYPNFRSIRVYATDNSGNQRVGNTGVSINDGIIFGNFSFRQTKDSLMFSIVATDDSQIASVTVDLASVKGQNGTVMNRMAADSFYVSISATDVTVGSKKIMYTITDNTGNVIRFYNTITIKNLSVSVAELKQNNKSFAYPVPSKGSITINESVSGRGIVEVFNNKGMNCYYTEFDTNSSRELNLSSLKSGVYYIMLSTDTGKLTQKVVIE